MNPSIRIRRCDNNVPQYNKAESGIVSAIAIYMKHFHTSDQREKPVYKSHIALVLEC